ncbi:MAG: GNAT family N-acetyltransferase [Candidatus Falkowbacteria bacterium]|nr:GNAT family N-acetyltransferase [Candidatus Falkowbacteria bacterium]
MEPLIFKKNILNGFQELKNGKFGEVRISCLFNGQKYQLILLTAECFNDIKLMELLSRWRKKHEFWFQAQFPISAERTIAWFKNKVIGAPDRLLFIIKVDDLYIGHVGLFRFNFENLTCEIDNIVRGEDNVVPGIIGDSVAKMMEWGKNNFGIKNYTLQTTSDNDKALRLYDKMGFVEIKRIPLLYQKTEEGGQWIEAPAEYNEPIKRYDVYMELKK